MVTHPVTSQPWPPLPLESWEDTKITLHMWTQMVGKVKLALAPAQNHWWHVPLEVSARGLSTGPLPYQELTFGIEFDLIDHVLIVVVCDGREARMALEPMTVADFYRQFFELLASLEIDVSISPHPTEVPDPVPFEEDTTHASYDRETVSRCFQILAQTDIVLRESIDDFLGKRSPVQFFWGAFDLAMTQFSGRQAPEHPGGVPNLPDRVVREAYSHEVSSAGWWPGDARLPEPAYFSYTYPEPPGFKEAAIEPAAAYYSDTLYEWILPYEAVRTADDPGATLLAFLKSTYNAGASLGGWDRAALER